LLGVKDLHSIFHTLYTNTSTSCESVVHNHRIK